MLLAAGVACGDDDDDPEPTATATSSDAGSTPTQAGAESTSTTVPAGSGSSDGEWNFTDDSGKTITLPQRPERVVSYVPIAASLWDFGVHPVGVFGTTVRPDGTPEITSGKHRFRDCRVARRGLR